jgi:gamma-glutamyltranspeptidase/glutathione hydrolase
MAAKLDIQLVTWRVNMQWTFNRLVTTGLFLTSTLTLTSQALANQATDAIAPEQSTGVEKKQLKKAKNYMVTAANPIATQAGADVIEQGGNAIDAMVAVQLMLGLVEPQSSGIGGGAFLVYWDNDKQKLTTFDGRETAPLAATPQLFLDDNGQPLQFYDAVVGGRSVGTPGTVKLLWDTHQKYGKLEWKKIIQPIIKLAEQGFSISSRLASLIEGDAERLSRFPATKAYFFNPDGSPKSAGTTLKNPQYAQTLTAIAEKGAVARKNHEHPRQ